MSIMACLVYDLAWDRRMVNLMEWMNIIGKGLWRFCHCFWVQSLFSYFIFLFVFHFYFLICFCFPSSLIRCENLMESCTLSKVLDCVYICPWPGDCSQRESGVVTLEH